MEPTFEDKKKIAEFFFEVENETKREFKCKLCSGRDISKFCVSKKGYENLMNHLESKCHKEEWKDVYKASFTTNVNTLDSWIKKSSIFLSCSYY